MRCYQNYIHIHVYSLVKKNLVILSTVTCTVCTGFRGKQPIVRDHTQRTSQDQRIEFLLGSDANIPGIHPLHSRVTPPDP